MLCSIMEDKLWPKLGISTTDADVDDTTAAAAANFSAVLYVVVMVDTAVVLVKLSKR